MPMFTYVCTFEYLGGSNLTGWQPKAASPWLAGYPGKSVGRSSDLDKVERGPSTGRNHCQQGSSFDFPFDSQCELKS
jgi:hypothetical protein